MLRFLFVISNYTAEFGKFFLSMNENYGSKWENNGGS